MELKSVKSADLRLLAKRFRAQADECAEDYYRTLILRTAKELDEHAAKLDANGGTELMITDDEMAEAGQLS